MKCQNTTTSVLTALVLSGLALTLGAVLLSTSFATTATSICSLIATATDVDDTKISPFSVTVCWPQAASQFWPSAYPNEVFHKNTGTWLPTCQTVLDLSVEHGAMSLVGSQLRQRSIAMTSAHCAAQLTGAAFSLPVKISFWSSRQINATAAQIVSISERVAMWWHHTPLFPNTSDCQAMGSSVNPDQMVSQANSSWCQFATEETLAWTLLPSFEETCKGVVMLAIGVVTTILQYGGAATKHSALFAISSLAALAVSMYVACIVIVPVALAWRFGRQDSIQIAMEDSVREGAIPNSPYTHSKGPKCGFAVLTRKSGSRWTLIGNGGRVALQDKIFFMSAGHVFLQMRRAWASGSDVALLGGNGKVIEISKELWGCLSKGNPLLVSMSKATFMTRFLNGLGVKTGTHVGYDVVVWQDQPRLAAALGVCVAKPGHVKNDLLVHITAFREENEKVLVSSSLGSLQECAMSSTHVLHTCSTEAGHSGSLLTDSSGSRVYGLHFASQSADFGAGNQAHIIDDIEMLLIKVGILASTFYPRDVILESPTANKINTRRQAIREAEERLAEETKGKHWHDDDDDIELQEGFLSSGILFTSKGDYEYTFETKKQKKLSIEDALSEDPFRSGLVDREARAEHDTEREEDHVFRDQLISQVVHGIQILFPTQALIRTMPIEFLRALAPAMINLATVWQQVWEELDNAESMPLSAAEMAAGTDAARDAVDLQLYGTLAFGLDQVIDFTKLHPELQIAYHHYMQSVLSCFTHTNISPVLIARFLHSFGFGDVERESKIGREAFKKYQRLENRLKALNERSVSIVAKDEVVAARIRTVEEQLNAIVAKFEAKNDAMRVKHEKELEGVMDLVERQEKQLAANAEILKIIAAEKKDVEKMMADERNVVYAENEAAKAVDPAALTQAEEIMAMKIAPTIKERTFNPPVEAFRDVTLESGLVVSRPVEEEFAMWFETTRQGMVALPRVLTEQEKTATWSAYQSWRKSILMGAMTAPVVLESRYTKVSTDESLKSRFQVPATTASGSTSSPSTTEAQSGLSASMDATDRVTADTPKSAPPLAAPSSESISTSGVGKIAAPAQSGGRTTNSSKGSNKSSGSTTKTSKSKREQQLLALFVGKSWAEAQPLAMSLASKGAISARSLSELKASLLKTTSSSETDKN